MLAPKERTMAVDKAGRHIELVGVRYLNPTDQVLEEMLKRC